MAHSGLLIYMTNVPEKGDNWRELFAPLPCPMWPGYKGKEEAPSGFQWNGHSSGILSPLFPRHNHPIASSRHDFRCGKTRNAEQRKWADEQFRIDVGTTSWWITKHIGYIGVRAGALIGIGNNF